MPVAKTVTGTPFQYTGSLRAGLTVEFAKSALRVSPATILVIRNEITSRSPVRMGACRRPLVSDSVGETLQLSYGVCPQVMSYVLPLLVEEGFCTVRTRSPSQSSASEPATLAAGAKQPRPITRFRRCPVGTDLEFRSRGEYHSMKTLWALHETLIATLMVFERTGADWAARYFGLAQQVIDEKFSMHRRGLPGFMLFADRLMTAQEHVARQDNYHPPRQLMLCLRILERMMGRGPATAP